MAKDLPYFKFFCSEWNDGDIALEDYEVQGLFINLCSYYWSNECNLTFKKAEKKFKDAPEDLWQTLLESEVIKETDDYLIISFLDEQKGERIKRSEIRSKGGKASAEARRLKKLEKESNITLTEKQHVLNLSLTKPQLLREEKIREDKKREEILINFEKLVLYINKKTGRGFKVINQSIKYKYKARLKEGYSNQDIHDAINNSVKADYHKESNFKYLTPEFFSRSTILDKYSNTKNSKSENNKETMDERIERITQEAKER